MERRYTQQQYNFYAYTYRTQAHMILYYILRKYFTFTATILGYGPVLLRVKYILVVIYIPYTAGITGNIIYDCIVYNVRTGKSNTLKYFVPQEVALPTSLSE